MPEIQLGLVESRFADMIWSMEPVTTTELVKKAEAAFAWKRTTTHTVIKRLCDKGLFENRKGTVVSLISREQFYSMQSKQYVEDTFAGSLPAFIAAFTKNRRLSAAEISEIRRIIDGTEEK
ncbi:MAG: BlaI/MecI/CopY family transcriptional regulator [Lachnospiraceae bacterium]|nr:BlaI/MecI/CopY family transcriptional regulator [Lachnospiraceae bacterium]MBP5222648.1 BlaI/MecI/CopY family transcriptional regulator [Lachnospiraceae bacterium]